MYVHDSLFGPGTAFHVSVNSTNEYMATAGVNGNITIRSIAKIKSIYETCQPVADNSATTTKDTAITTLKQVSNTPTFDQSLITEAEKVINVVNVRSRSKITCLKYANLLNNTNLLAAVYKNGEVFIITNPQDVNKCRIQHIFKHANGLILDFCWSADDQLMAFSSMNNEVILYDVIYGKIISTLHLHENFQVHNSKEDKDEIITVPIKGLMFDRLNNKHLITLGDDKNMQIIEYHLTDDEFLGRKFDYKITRSFNHIITSSKLNKASIKKICISCDDKLILLPNTSKNKTMKLSFINFDQKDGIWKFQKEISVDGLKCFSTLFSPIAYKGAKENEIVYVLATLSTDSALSICRSDDDTPVYVVQDLPAVSDFCFSSDGSMLFLTTTTGSLISLVLDPNEFGDVATSYTQLSKDLHKMTSELLPKQFEKMNQWRLYAANHPNLVKQKEKELFDLEKSKTKVKLIKTNASSTNATALADKTSSPAPGATTNPIVVSSTATPEPAAPEMGKSVLSKKVEESNIKESSKKEPTQKADDKKETSKKDPAKKPSQRKEDSSATVPAKRESTIEEKDDKENKKQKPNEKALTAKATPAKAALPTKTSTKATPLTKTSTKAVVKETESKANGSAIKKKPLNNSNYESASNAVPKDVNLKVAKMVKSKTAEEADGVAVTNKKKRDIDQVEFVGSVLINPQVSFSNIRIGTPKLKNIINYKLQEDSSLFFEIKNGNGLESQPTRVSFNTGNDKIKCKQLFVDYLPYRIHTVCGSKKYLAIASDNGQIITYSLNGRRILPVLVLGSPLSFLEMNDKYLLAVTSVGELFVWDLERKRSLFRSVSLYPLLKPLYSHSNDITNESIVSLNGELITRSENLTICSITSNGIPIITLSNGNGYLFNSDMNIWTLVSDSWWAFGSQYWDLNNSKMKNDENENLIEFLENYTNEEIIKRGKIKFFTKISKKILMNEGYENLELIISLNHLENKIIYYQHLKDFRNFKNNLIIYCKKLSEMNLKERLLEVLNNLFQNLNEKVVGESKKDLLQDLILNCSKHREVQNILVQYSESIGLLNDESDLDI